jgi:hypothetical protein
VAAREMPCYTANLARARRQLSYGLDWSDALPPPVAAAGIVAAGFGDRLNWSLLLLVAFALALFARLARRGWRYDPAPAPAPAGSADTAPVGLQGWLWLYTLGVLLLPLRLARQLWDNASAYGGIAWSTHTTFGAAHYHPWYAPALLYELLGLVALLVASLLLLRLYFARRSSYPRLAVATYAAAFIFQLVDLLLAARLPGQSLGSEDWGRLAEVAIGAVVWCTYLLRSRRVRATFVRRLKAAAPLPAAPGAMIPANA